MAKVQVPGFSIALPEGWRTVNTVFVSPPIGDASTMPTLSQALAARQTVAVAAEPVPSGTTPRAYHEAQLAQLAQAGQDIQVAETEEIDLNGRPGLRTVIVSEGLGGSRMRQIQLISIKDDTAWTVVGSLLEGPDQSDAAHALEATLRSIDLL